MLAADSPNAAWLHDYGYRCCVDFRGIPTAAALASGTGQAVHKFQLAGLAVQMNIFDPGVMLNLFPWNPSYVEQCSPILRRDHLSVYYKGYGNWLGHRLNEFAKLVNAPVHGAITYTYPVLGGVEVGGWADDSQVLSAKPGFCCPAIPARSSVSDGGFRRAFRMPSIIPRLRCL
jgi:hypothetical protein